MNPHTQDAVINYEHETVDPRVQIELEKLNAATDDINRLEVDLDEARAGFRQLLCESSVRIDALARKLGSCVEKARPYYEARIRAKEALCETQIAALRFERANSAHAAAKEMVYLAEEGLCTEGRTFDHAWQEMLNHATMRVNESELERTLSETEHRRRSQTYQRAEIRVQQLQKELKRSIAKSSVNTRFALSAYNGLATPTCLMQLPYFELKAQFNQLLEEQKTKVKELEGRVGAAKASYSEALSNLEQISDEIHRIRKYESEQEGRSKGNSKGVRQPFITSSATSLSAATPSSSTDHWSDSDSTGSSYSESEEQYLQLPDKLGPAGSPIVPKKSQEINTTVDHHSVFVSSSSSSLLRKRKDMCDKTPVPSSNEAIQDKCHAAVSSSNSFSPGDRAEEENMMQSLFSKIVPAKLRRSNTDRSFAKAENPSMEISKDGIGDPTFSTGSGICNEHRINNSNSNLIREESANLKGGGTWSEYDATSPDSNKQSEIWTEVNLNDSSSQSTDTGDMAVPMGGMEDVKSTPKPDSTRTVTGWISRSSVEQNSNSNSNGSRRHSFDTLIMGSLATGERVKEILSHGIMKLNISSLTERRSNSPPVPSASQSTLLTATKKVPSPLEKSILYLNTEDDSTSDSESLASVEMLSDEQISSLMLDSEIQQVREQVLASTLGETNQLQG